MATTIEINGRQIGKDQPTYIIAEISANHNQSIDQAFQLLEAAKLAGADAVKLQTYTADTLTIDSNKPYFQIDAGTLWDGRNLYDLYHEAHTPWAWQPKLKEAADTLGIDLFSTPFDATAVAFLEELEMPAYKVASFEIVDLPLLRSVAKTGKPVIMSTGMANLAEISEAVDTLRANDCVQLALLKCTSAYPATPSQMNLRTIPHLAEAFDTPVGLSDHTMGLAAPVAAVALGACVIEKHITLSRDIPGPDSAFSLEPNEFSAMVDAVRNAEQALGTVTYSITEEEAASRVFRRSLFVVEDMKAGDIFNNLNVRSIRPSHGLHTRHLADVLGQRCRQDIERGTPLSWSMVLGQ